MTATCSSTNAQLVAAVGRLHGDSALRFEWDATGACTTIIVTTSSEHEPKAP